MSIPLMFFLACAALGTLLTLIDIFSGGLFDNDVHFDSEVNAEGAGLFSFRTIIIFLAVFGAVGGIFHYQGLSVVYSSFVGIGAGLMASMLAYYLMRAAFNQQASSLIENGDLVGSRAVVTTTIPKNGIGEVMIELKGQRKYLSAREANHREVAIHALVTIKESQSGFVIIEKSE